MTESEDDEYKKILEEKAKRRQILRDYFQREKSNPFRHALDEGGTVFDPSMQRHTALHASYYDFFKPNLKNAKMALLCIILPLGVYGYFLKTTREARECRYRRGEVAYKDRRFKFIG